MTTSQEIKTLLNKKFVAKQDRITALPGQLGNGQGGLTITGRDNYVYVRVANAVAEVFNNRVLPENDLLVMVGYDPAQPDLFQVLSTRTAQPGGVYGGAFSGPPPASRYQWMAPGGGQDPLFVELRQFMHLRIGPAGGMLLQVYRGVIWTGTGWAAVPTQNIDLTASIPTTAGNAVLVLISLDDTGTVVATAGSEFVLADQTTAALMLAQIPSIPTGTTHVLGAVRVYTGQTAIQEARTNTDIIDLRFSGWGGGSSGSATIANHDHSGDTGDGGRFPLVNLFSTGATSGQVATADGSGGIAFTNPFENQVLNKVTAEVSNPPTENELETALGTPYTVGEGRSFLLIDTSSQRAYIVISDGTAYRYLPMVSPTAAAAPPADPNLPTDAVWCWFADPRAIYYNGKTYVAYSTHLGSTAIAAYTHATGQFGSVATVQTGLIEDDHNNPGMLIRDSDKRLMLFWSQHSASSVYMATSNNPEDASAWGAPVNIAAQLGGGSYTYMYPVQLLGETDDPIYLFFRLPISDSTTALRFSKSTNGGTTWAAQTLLYSASGRSSYYKVLQNGADRIDFAVTDGHPMYDADVSIYHFYYQGGNYYKTDGTLITASLPLSPSDITKIYDGVTGETAWIWDVAIDGIGKPIVVFTTYPTTTDHRYNYGRWTGSAWDTHEITPGGTNIISSGAEVYYSGGVILDGTDPATVYLSKQVSGQFEIYQYVTADGGATWTNTALTSGSTAKNIRPIVPRNHASDLKVIWLYGTYTNYLNYMMGLKIWR